MSYQVTGSFQGGLDARKFYLSQPPGTLGTLKNGHITQGGEIEKRKAFQPYAAPLATFGAEPLDTSIVIFGSREFAWQTDSVARAGNSCTAYFSNVIQPPVVGDQVTVSGASDATFNGTFVLTYVGPVGSPGSGIYVVVYANAGSDATETSLTTFTLVLNAPLTAQRLQHPDGVTQMTALVSSTSFAGQIWAVATFADGRTFHYYNGELVPDFTDGLAQAGALTAYDMAVNIAAAINRSSNFTATPPSLPAALSLTVAAAQVGTPAVAATDSVAFSAAPANGQTITIGATTYTFVTTLVNATPNQVLRSTTIQTNVQNLYNAINAGAGSGTLYSSATVANTQVSAGNLNLSTPGFQITALTAGTAGNAITVSVNSGFAAWATAYLTGGAAAVPSAGNLISLYYDFGRVVPLTSGFSTSAALLALNIPTGASLAATATAIAASVNAATDAYAGGSGINLGFIAVATGNTVTITPPIAVSKIDTLLIATDNAMQITTPPDTYAVLVYSVPEATGGKPYAATLTVDSTTGSVVASFGNAGVASVAALAASAGFQIVAGGQNTPATGTLTSTNVNPFAGDAVTIGTVVYNLVGSLNGGANQVAIQGSADATLAALAAAINNAAGAGTLYSSDLAKHPLVSAGAVTAHAITVTAITGGTPGNSIPTLVTSGNLSLSWGAATMTGGGPDTNQITQIQVGSTNLLGSYVQFNQNVTQTAIDVSNAINSLTASTGYSASANAGIVTLTATSPGTAANNQVVTVTSAGNICVYNCAFSLANFVTNTSAISAISVGATNLLTATLTYQDAGHATETSAQFLGRIVANLNANSGTSGWLAYTNGTSINVSKSVVASTDVVAAVTVTGVSISISLPSSSPVLATVAPTVVTFYNNNTGVWSGNSQTAVSVTGGLYPYSYKWTYTGTGQSVATPSDPTSPSPTWTMYLAFTTLPYSENWICTVTDSLGSTGVTQSVILSAGKA
ncbi:MAG: hypothetical protein KGL39_15625 [Patescibacteria group bacterium]|nr:hypothetical protein [Patescibacteria group bacterium]